MLSRRNVRIKVMQVLYTASRDSDLSYPHIERAYRSRVQNSYKTYLFNVHYLYKIAAYAKRDEDHRHNKMLPSADDLKFQAIIARNELTHSIAENAQFFEAIKDYNLAHTIDIDTVRDIYHAFADNEAYLAYSLADVHTDHDHLTMLLDLYKFMVKHELFIDKVEDHFPTWTDDESLVVGAVKKTLKALPAHANFFRDFEPDAETVEDYGTELLYKVWHRDDALMEMIKPKLQNWEADRVAILDMILLKMAIIEFLHFPTIPTKVTINEYIDISKKYSTPKSKDFINGLLDKLQRELQAEGRIQKEARE